MEFNTLYHELQYSTEMIRALLAGVAPEAARLKPRAESWSMLEVVCHLYDEEREDFREHLDFILHRQNEEWHAIDTEGWVTQRKYNEQNYTEMQEKFFVEREKSFAWLTGLLNPDWEKTIQPRTAPSTRERCSPVGSRMTISTSANWWNSGA